MSHCALAGKACACEILPHACPLSCNFFANRGPPCGMSASPSSEVAKGVTSMISRTSTAVASCHWVAASASLQPLQHGLYCFSNARKKICGCRSLSVTMNSSQPTIQPENAIEFLSMMERLKVIRLKDGGVVLFKNLSYNLNSPLSFHSGRKHPELGG
jgi:hypothetical protein